MKQSSKYALRLVCLLATGHIRFQTAARALRTRPAAVAGKGGYYEVGDL